jgi:hypothetical protein
MVYREELYKSNNTTACLLRLQQSTLKYFYALIPYTLIPYTLISPSPISPFPTLYYIYQCPR